MVLKLPIYMDHHSTTPVDPRVLQQMLPYFSEDFGNAASRTHAFGWRAEEAVERARAQVASLLRADAKEIIFTSGATESDNLALFGAMEANRNRGDHLITQATEHKAVVDSARRLEKQGWKVTFLPVDPNGQVDPDRLRRALTPRTVLVTIMTANNEVGTVQRIAELARISRQAGVLFHTDAAQGMNYVPLNVEELEIDLLSLSAHKIYGPKGVGALWIRRRTPRIRIEPLLHGGGHERGLRSGTLPVPNVVGLGAACEIVREEGRAEGERLRALSGRMLGEITRRLDQVTLNGHPQERLPNNLNLSFAGVEGESLMMGMPDVAVSSGSACTSATQEPSYVLKALGVPDSLAHASIRFGLGRSTTAEEVDFVVDRVVAAVDKLRAISPAYEKSRKTRQ
jgi:cysteine desulfurase